VSRVFPKEGARSPLTALNLRAFPPSITPRDGGAALTIDNRLLANPVRDARNFISAASEILREVERGAVPCRQVACAAPPHCEAGFRRERPHVVAVARGIAAI
jgi:hypothetical protein